MKLKANFFAQELDDTQVLIDTAQNDFKGLVRSNSTAAFIVNLLREDTTKEEIVSAMLKKYDAPKAVISADVAEILEKLRSVNALEE